LSDRRVCGPACGPSDGLLHRASLQSTVSRERPIVLDVGNQASNYASNSCGVIGVICSLSGSRCRWFHVTSRAEETTRGSMNRHRNIGQDKSYASARPQRGSTATGRTPRLHFNGNVKTVNVLHEPASQSILWMRDVVYLTGVHRSTIHRWMRMGLFPQKEAPRHNPRGWLKSTYERWLNGETAIEGSKPRD
jgi:predicted DNA-binding transcriptional regulator AlpA